jgi:hypothetical protein
LLALDRDIALLRDLIERERSEFADSEPAHDRNDGVLG